MTEQSLTNEDPNTIIQLTAGELRLLLIEARMDGLNEFWQSSTERIVAYDDEISLRQSWLYKKIESYIDKLKAEHTALSKIVERLGDE